MPEIRTWVQVIYLGSDSTKHEHRNKKNDIVKEEETNIRVLYSGQCSGQQGILRRTKNAFKN